MVAGNAVQFELVPSTLRDPVFMNARRKPYDDIRVRQAISLALDRDAAIKVIWRSRSSKEGAARRGGYMAPRGSWAIPETELRTYEGYDGPNIERGKQLLTPACVSTPLEASATTRTDFKDPQIDALFEKQSQTMDIETRRTLVRELEHRALSQHQIAVMFFEDLIFARRTNVRNFVFHSSLYTNRRMEAVWKDAG